MDQAIEDEFTAFNFFVVYQLGETYNSGDLRQITLEHIEANPFIFNRIMDLK
jgi:hypothetical protein